MPLLANTILAGRLIASGLACGLNLYATIALIGLGSRFGWIELPPALIGLEQWLLIIGALLLFCAEFIAGAIPVVDSIWEGAHTVIRPIAAGALAMTALEAVPWPVRIAAGLATALAAFAAHSAKVGLRLVVTRRRTRRILVSAAEDVVAATLAVLAMAWPWAAAAAVAVFAIILVRTGPGLWRASAFAVRAVLALMRGFFGERGWLSAGQLPTTIRQRVPEPELGAPDPKALRVALDSPASGPWRNGWLVLNGRTARFIYRKSLQTHEIQIPRPDAPTIRHRPLADIVAWSADDKPFALHFLKDGPPAEIAVGTLQATIL